MQLSTINYLRQTWDTFSKQFDKPIEADLQFKEIVGAYSEPHRFYHTTDHIKNMLQDFKTIRKELDNPNLVEFAIWYHDIVYSTTYPNLLKNELHSANMASESANAFDVKPEDIKAIYSLVLSTKNHKPIQNHPDSKYLIDINMKILGSSTEEYNTYKNNIQKEFAQFPDSVYKTQRAKALKNILNSGNIFHTNEFQIYETKARANLENELQSLKQ